MAVYAMTGSATGIGGALREQLCDRGDRVIGVDIKAADLVADLSTGEGRRAAIEGIKAAAPDGLDGFIPCAGLGPHVDNSALIARVNYFAVIATVVGLRDWVAKKQGTILLVSSNSVPMMDNENEFVQSCLAGDEAATCLLAEQGDGYAVYAGAKRALTLWMRRQVNEYARAGVRLNAVAPGFTLTPLTEAGMASEEFGQMLRDFADTIPVGRAGQPQEIANVMRFLLGPEAAFVCGSLFFVDGGSDTMLYPDRF